MSNQVHVWQQQDAAQTFLDDIRGAIPLAAEQIDVILRTIRHALPTVASLLDLGLRRRHPRPDRSGRIPPSHRRLSRLLRIHDRNRTAKKPITIEPPSWSKVWPKTTGQDRSSNTPPSTSCYPAWPSTTLRTTENDRSTARSSTCLSPGGLFLNLEHVAGHSTWASEAFDELFVDSLWSHHQKRGGTKSRDAVVVQWQNRRGKAADILTPLDVQCRWLRECGFVDVDCFLKIFELAIFGGTKTAIGCTVNLRHRRFCCGKPSLSS